MTLKDLLHEEYETAGGEEVWFECTECGNRYQSLGTLHAHVEGHWSTLGFLRWHFIDWIRPSASNKWMEYTRVVKAEETAEIELREVEGL